MTMPDAIDQTTLGFIGVGNMGMGMLTRWRSLGGQAIAFDIDPQRLVAAAAIGAQTAGSARAVVDDLPPGALLVVCVVNGDDCREVLWGPGGVCSGNHRQLTVLLTPTLSPEDVEAFASRLGEAGIDMIDAPMSGGPIRAAAGTMSLMVAGPKRRAWWHVLAALAHPVFDLGETVGDGAKTKLVNNLLAAVNLVGAAQVMTLAQRLQLDPVQTLSVIAQSSGQSWIASDRLERALAGDSTTRAHMGLLAKDSRLAMEAASQVGFEPTLGALAQATFAEAMARGLGDADDSAMLSFVQTLASAKGTQT
jgi:putative dehydrogenase